MCILLGTTAHPDYELILISNRDEFFQRKTHSTCWNQDNSILSPYDMSLHNIEMNKNYGTWCGINKTFDKVSVVLNLKDIQDDKLKFPRSRGMLPINYLSTDKDFKTYDEFVKDFPNVKQTGGFNLFMGDFKNGKYHIIDSLGQSFNVLDKNNKNMVISNDKYNSLNKWGKIEIGEKLIKQLLNKKINNKNELIENCFKIASYDTINKNCQIDNANNTIFVPPIMVKDKKYPTGYYGTRSTILIMVNKLKNHITFIERIIHACDDDVNMYSFNNPFEEKKFEIDI